MYFHIMQLFINLMMVRMRKLWQFVKRGPGLPLLLILALEAMTEVIKIKLKGQVKPHHQRSQVQHLDLKVTIKVHQAKSRSQGLIFLNH